MKKRKTEVYANNGAEIIKGDRIEVILPKESIYSDMVLARGIVFFERGSFKIKKESGHVGDTPRLDDFAPKCIINSLPQ